MKSTYSHGREFVRHTLPLLARNDTPGLLEHLGEQWPNAALCELLVCGDEDARKVAVVCLALTGTMDEIPQIAGVLQDDDPTTAGFAEHAMWAIWFRADGPAAEHQLSRAVQRIGRNRLEEAISDLHSLIKRHPDLAEAYNQLAIAHFLQGDYAAAIDDCLQVLARNPYHFGALAGLGHCHAATGELAGALEAYRRALRVHPRLEGIRQTMMQIRRSMGSAKSKHAAAGPAPDWESRPVEPAEPREKPTGT